MLELGSKPGGGFETLKRTNRLILLIGVLLAVVAFVGIIVVFNNQSGSTAERPRTTTDVVVATRDIALGEQITKDSIGTKPVPKDEVTPDEFIDTGKVIGQVARQSILNGATLVTSMFTGSGSPLVASDLPAGMRAMAVRVDAVTGVGTLILPGDRVDVIVTVAITPVAITPATVGVPEQVLKVDALTGDSTKLILQNIEVRAVLGAAAGTTPASDTTTNTSSQAAVDVSSAQQVVILALSPQDAEALGYIQQTGIAAGSAQPSNNVTLVLRSPKDKDVPPGKTTGIVLSTLITDYGVLPPGAVEASPAAR